MGSTHKTIYMPDIRQIVVALPPRDEQRQIVSRIRDSLSSINEASDAAVGQVHLLAEYRQALISAAVTGQIEITAKPPIALTPTVHS